VVLARAVSVVTLSPPSSSVEVGSSVQLSTRLTDSAGNLLSGRVVGYVSDNTAVATVSSTGLVTGVSAGTAQITARSEGRSGTATVRVVPQPVATVRISPPTARLTPGATVQLTAIPASAAGTVLGGRAVTWIGAPGVATVSPSGLVTGIAPGTAIIFAQVEGVLGSATITVAPSRSQSDDPSPGADPMRYIRLTRASDARIEQSIPRSDSVARAAAVILKSRP
jgi:uncharacterized protein YjdB